jgi:hypothetical protein
MDHLDNFLVSIGQHDAYIKSNPMGAEVRSDGSHLWSVLITIEIDPEYLPESYEQYKNELWTVQEVFTYWIKTNDDSIDKDVNYIENKAAAMMYDLLTDKEGNLDLEYVRKLAAE